MYEFVLYNSYKNCMILYAFVQKPQTIVWIRLYEFVPCTNSYYTMCIQFGFKNKIGLENKRKERSNVKKLSPKKFIV